MFTNFGGWSSQHEDHMLHDECFDKNNSELFRTIKNPSSLKENPPNCFINPDLNVCKINQGPV